MELQTISQVSKDYGISMRMLRYYEQVGLINSIRNEENSYRFYDETAIKRLHHIIILRKLRISVKQIADILNNSHASSALEIFERNINEIDEEMTSLSTVKLIMKLFVGELRDRTGLFLHLDLLDNKSALSAIDSLSFSKNYINNTKENLSMENLNKANRKLNKLTDRDVRIIYLPPSTIASIHHIGCSPQSEIPESTTAIQMREFVRGNNIAKIKPDLRHYGFNHPDSKNSEEHGYERWVTIPENMEIPKPFVKKQFSGGLYAAYMITNEDWEEWSLLWEWIKNSEKYEFNSGDPNCMDGALEEYLNHINLNISDDYYDRVWQIDLLVPIKEKKNLGAK